jgi:hypothetical protein
MADENVVETSPEEIAQAKDLGWADKDQWRGPPEHWVDAKTFLEKGQHVLPILKQNNERLRGELGAVRGEVAGMKDALKAATTTIEALNAAHEEDVKEQVEAARADLRAQLSAASREGDHDAVADATAKLSALNAAEAEKDARAKENAAAAQARRAAPEQMPPENKAWMDSHPEFTANPRAVMLGHAVAAEMRQAGDKTVGPAFLDKVKAEVDAVLGLGTQRGGHSKVEGPRGGNGGGGNAGSGKTFADLPAEAKAACERQGARLVGATRAHKTIDSWRASYVKQYFGE